MSDFKKIQLFTDGGSKGNPGPGYIGIVIFSSDDETIHEYSKFIGNCTNNQAEYQALIEGLELSKKYTKMEVICTSDSELLIKQMNGEYQIKNPMLRELWREVKIKSSCFNKVTFKHVKRGNEKIQQADRLLNDAHHGFPVDTSFKR
jgi:ribonuclease HI